MKKAICLCLILISAAGCGAQMKDFVLSGRANPRDPHPSPSITSPSSKAIKVSPGAQTMKGTQLQGRVTVTSTRLPLAGAQLQGKIAVGQNRQSN